MNIDLVVDSVTNVDTPLLVVNLFEGVTEPKGATGAVDAALGRIISRMIADGELTGKLNEVVVVHTFERLPAKRVAVVGLGKQEEFTVDRARQAAGSVVTRARGLKVRSFATVVHGAGQGGLSPREAAVALAEGTLLANYRYTRFKTELAEAPPDLERATVVELDAGRSADLRAGIERGRILAEATNLARDLSNGPGNLVTPTYLADQAAAMASAAGIECEVLGPEETRALNMGALLGVAQGSVQPSRFVVLRYRRGGEGAKTLAMVGKGITFDSGGISIKPGERMEEMKHDMSGAAAVIGAIQAIAALAIPVNVLGLIPATENLPSGSALKPGDILTAMNGKTIEVVNTDAEGRIVLADALAYAVREGVDAIVDLATLTGACVIALGAWASGAVSNHDGLMASVEESGRRTGDRVWRLPDWSEYAEQIKSDVADVKNIGGRAAGVITGALFLTRFHGGKPWVHLDIAGTANIDKDRPYTPKGATGFGVRLLVDLAETWAKQPPV